MTTLTRVLRAGGLGAIALVALLATAPSTQAAVRSAPPCSATDLSAKVTGSGAGMSQPAVYITVTNTSDGACTVKGYPTITGAWTKIGQQDVTVTNGAVMNAPAAKPKTIRLSPGGRAWFALGAGTAYESPIVTFSRVTFSTVPGSSVGVGNLRLQANAPTGQPYPLGVTAFAPGVGRSE
jgi:hypothetical protein